MSGHDDFAFEPVRGLPAPLPAGERLLWQGSPQWRSLAIHAYHVRKVALYFLALVVWRVAAGLGMGHTAAAIALGCAWLAGLGALAAGLLSLLAYFGARSTVYSITTGRVIARHGVAVPMTVNIPYALVDTAAVRRYADGCGDLSIGVPREHRVGYLITWPHVRPGRFTRPELSFRSLRDVAQAAAVLAEALRATVATPGGALSPAGARPLPAEAGPRTAAVA
jgi:hypothetical protein